MTCTSRFATAILSGETELSLGTRRVCRVARSKFTYISSGTWCVLGWPPLVYTYVGILTVDVVFFRSPGVFHSQDSFPSTFHPRLWETASGVVAVGVFADELIVIVTAELILQPFRHFTYITAYSPTLPSLYLYHSSFSNPSYASPTSQALHLRHLASRPWEY